MQNLSLSLLFLSSPFIPPSLLSSPSHLPSFSFCRSSFSLSQSYSPHISVLILPFGLPFPFTLTHFISASLPPSTSSSRPSFSLPADLC